MYGDFCDKTQKVPLIFFIFRLLCLYFETQHTKSMLDISFNLHL